MSENEIAKLQEEVEESALIEKEQKFSIAKFGIGIAKLITSFSFIAYGYYSYIVGKVVYKAFTLTGNDLLAYLSSPVNIILVGGWVLATVIVVAHLQKAFDAMIRKIDVEAKIGFNKNFDMKATADATQIIDSIKKN